MPRKKTCTLSLNALRFLNTPAVHGIELLQIDAACSAESADIGKLIQVVQGSVESKKSAPGKSGHGTVVPISQCSEIGFDMRNDFIH